MCPPRVESVLPPVLWKSCDQILLAFKVRFAGDPSPFLDSQAGEPYVGPRTFTWCDNFFGITVFHLWVAHLMGIGFDFILVAPLLLPPYFSFVLGCVVSFFGGFQHPPVNGCSTASCDCGAFAGENECMSFYSTILNQS